MAEKQLDTEQQAAVLANANTVVVAGAGSGKTTVLAQRFVHLVADEHIPVDRILTLTFTRKAAAEMYERIYSLLRSHAENPFVATQVRRFDEAQISTLDSFCGRIVRAAAGAYGISPDYRTDETELAELARESALSLMVRHKANPVLARLVAANGFTAVLEEGFVPLGSGYLTLVPEQDFDELQRSQLRTLVESVDQGIDALENDADALLSADTGGSAAFERTQETVRGVDWNALRAPAEVLDSELGLPRSEEAYDGYLDDLSVRLEPLRQLNKRGGKSGDPATEAFKEQIEVLRTRAARIGELIETLRLRGDLRELFELVRRYRDTLSDEKRRRGLLSYNDVLSTAVAALAELPSLRSFFGGRFDRIMIDEFQDNNEKQKQLLYLLSLAAETPGDAERPGPAATVGPAVHATADQLAPGKLFFVGDEKQSIYRFRGADVRAFKGLSRELSGAGRDRIVLRTNYRSAPGLIAVFNELFSRIMGTPQADHEARFEALTPAAESGAASFELLVAQTDYGAVPEEAGANADTEEAGTAEEREELLPADQAEAYAVAERIQSAVHGGEVAGRRAIGGADTDTADEKGSSAWLVPDGDGGTRRPKYHEIAVLMRSSGNQYIFERVFRAFGIPYRTQGVRSLFLEAPASDVYAWLRLVAVSDDSSAYAAALRSPLVGVSDDAIGRILGREEAPFAMGEDLRELLGAADAERFVRGAEVYERLCELGDVEPHRALISEIWYRFGYRYLLLREPSYHSYLEHYDYLLELAALHEGEALAAFTEVLRERLGSFERLDDVDVDAPEDAGVQIMTIHKSKGLEFPIVILANAGNTGRNEGMGTSPFYVSDRHGLTMNLPVRDWRIDKRLKSNYFFEVGKEEEKAQAQAELKRLLYVALTRAQRHILVSGVFHKNTVTSSEHLLNMVIEGFGADPASIARPGEAVTSVELPNLPGVDLSISRIPEVPRSHLHRRGGRRRRLDLASYRRGLEEVPTVELAVPRREFSVTELAQAAEEPGTAAEPETRDPSGSPALDTAELGEGVDIDLSALPENPEATFGTIAHAAVDLMLGAEDLDRAVVSLEDLPKAVRRNVDDAALRPILRAAEAMARDFLQSTYGGRLRAQRGRVRVEEPFLLHYPLAGDEVWISGQFDFIVAPEPTVRHEVEPVLIVDLKTDREPAPRNHALQMFLYRRAAEQIFGRPAVSVLHYLRYGHSVPLAEPFTDEEIARILAELR